MGAKPCALAHDKPDPGASDAQLELAHDKPDPGAPDEQLEEPDAHRALAEREGEEREAGGNGAVARARPPPDQTPREADQ